MPLADSQARVKDNVITLGAVVSETGRYSTAGLYMRRGYELAVEQINNGGGLRIGRKVYTLELAIRDDESVPGGGRDAVRYLVEEEKIRYLLGPFGQALTEAVALEAGKQGLPLVAPDQPGSGFFDSKPEFLFSLPTARISALESSLQMAREYEGSLDLDGKPLTLTIVQAADPLSVATGAETARLAGEKEIALAGQLELPWRPGGFDSVASKIGRQAPHILALIGDSSLYNMALKTFSASRKHPPLTILSDCEALKQMKNGLALADGMFCTTQWSEGLTYSDEYLGNGENFQERFEERFHDSPSVLSAQAAAAIVVYADAFKRASSFDPRQVRDALAATNMQTMFGNVKFDSAGRNSTKPMVLQQIRNGKPVAVAPAKWSASGIELPDR